MNKTLRRSYLVIFLFILFLPGLGDPNSNLFLPRSQTTYQLYLSIDSDYYDLNNIKVRVYDNITEEWNWCDPHEVIVQSTTYKLKLYDAQTGQLIFSDQTDQTRSDNYRNIEIDAIQIVNNQEYPITFISTPLSN